MEYTAITLGPIYNTTKLTSSPAGLWGASYIFSYIAEHLLVELVREGIRPEDVIVPYFEVSKDEKTGNISVSPGSGDSNGMYGIGVGMFHDRIYFVGNELEKAGKAIETVKNHIAEELWRCYRMGLGPGKGKTNINETELQAWVQSYFRIYAITCNVPDERPPILDLGKYMSAAELEPSYPAIEKEDPLLYLFEYVTASKSFDSGNAVIKGSFLVNDIWDNWMLRSSGAGDSLRDIKNIAEESMQGENDRKSTRHYYAVLNSDGDNMTSVLKTLKTVEDIRSYSKKCLEFCSEAAKCILEYGGMPVYAGGDDLMAIVPVWGRMGTASRTENREQKDTQRPSIVGLAAALRDIFNQVFESERSEIEQENAGKTEKDKKALPTFSIGIAVEYYKSPLYEALDHARNLLAEAKEAPKNTMQLMVHKHSGQSFKVSIRSMDESDTPESLENLISEEKLSVSDFQKLKGRGESVAAAADFEDLKDVPEMQKQKADTQKNAQGNAQEDAAKKLIFLSGAGYHVENYEVLFKMAFREPNDSALTHLVENLFDSPGQKISSEYIDRLLKYMQSLYKDCVRQGQGDDQVDKAVMNLKASLRLLHFMEEED